jgi:redox-sensitive bicupin YhaK (pirin superfamily)
MKETMSFEMKQERIKEVLHVYQPGSTHMVGDGFPVRNLFPSNDLDRRLSPFLMLDYAGPTYFPPTDEPRGVGEHPHRGFETVTIVYQGTVAHRDSGGNAGIIAEGDVQWMTAASGVVHEEKHEKEFAKRGGTLEAIQLWVNLPKAHKMSPPRYQTVLNAEIPVVHLGDGAGYARVIAGEFKGIKGPANTFTPVNLYDMRLNAGHQTEFSLPAGYTTALFVLNGEIMVHGRAVKEAELAVFDTKGETIRIDVKENATVVVLNGEPIPEPVAHYGPFVMNTREELIQAMQDYQAGRMGHLEPVP